MITIREIKEKTSKPYWSFSQRLRHQLAYPITKLFLKTSITPNTVTLLWIIQEIIGISLLFYGTYTTMLVGIIIFNFAFVLDAVDGQLARFQEKISYTGFYLDKIGHWIGTPLLFGALGMGTLAKTDQFVFVMIGIAIAFLHIFIELIDFNGFWSWCNPQRYPKRGTVMLKDVYHDFRVGSLAQRNFLGKYVLEFFKRSQPFNFLFFSLLFGLPHVALIAYLALFLLKFTFKLWKQFQALKKIDRTLMNHG